MLKEITLDEAAGKTIKLTASSFTARQMIFVFTDNTFTTLGLDKTAPKDCREIVNEPLNTLDFSWNKLVAAGVCSRHELIRMNQARQKEAQAVEEETEREANELSKKKFECEDDAPCCLECSIKNHDWTKNNWCASYYSSKDAPAAINCQHYTPKNKKARL